MFRRIVAQAGLFAFALHGVQVELGLASPAAGVYAGPDLGPAPFDCALRFLALKRSADSTRTLTPSAESTSPPQGHDLRGV